MIVESLFNDVNYSEAYTQFLQSIHSLSGSDSSVRTYDAFLRSFFTDPERDKSLDRLEQRLAFLTR
jgi:hypothetical protein